MNPLEVERLASHKGCTLKTMLTDESCLYWIESRYFVSRPYACLNDLVLLIQYLPVLLSKDSIYVV
jgi:hypothetical protein